MNAIVLVSVINHYHINVLHQFWDNLNCLARDKMEVEQITVLSMHWDDFEIFFNKTMILIVCLQLL